MKNLSATKLYTVAFGLFLGLCIWKFGNPVILDYKVYTPKTPAEFLGEAWPPHWANWILLPMAILGGLLIFKSRNARRHGKSEIRNPKSEIKWLWLLPLAWLLWQFASATHSVDAGLTTATLWQFSGCIAGYFLGALLIGREHLTRLLLIGVLAAFAFCLVRAVNQRIFEFPANYQMLIAGERNGWTNFPPATVADMKEGGIIINTNGVDAANPAILMKFAKGRVSGTLVYPNALAELVLLLWPVSLAFAFTTTRLRPALKLAAIAVTLFLGAAAFFWTGSKLGWLIAIAVAGFVLLRLGWSKKMKIAAVVAVCILGLGVFAVRFHNYFEKGATSAGARFDYWHAAVQTTVAHPLFGTGPGTFQRPYSLLKSPESEMARLAHNDFLEQFSDSGVIGGLAYAAWIVLALIVAGKRISMSRGKAAQTGIGNRQSAIANRMEPPYVGSYKFAIFVGLLGWFAQGLGEFGLYVPALAWTAFTLLGCLIAEK
jgi:O-antigen ligase